MSPDLQSMLRQYADVILDIGLNLQKGQRLLIVNSGLFGVDIALAPFVRLVAEGAYRRGADLVDVIWGDPLLDRIRLKEAQAGSLKDYPKWPAAARMEHVETASAYLALRGDDPDLLADIEATRVGDFLTPIRDLAKPLTPYLSRNYSNWCVACVSNPAWASKVLPDAPRDEQADRLWDLIFKACRMEAGDAVGTWRKHAAGLKKRATYMNNKAFDALRYSAPGTSLEVGLPAGHVWTGANMLAENGVSFIANIPTEEIFSLAHRGRVEGEVSSTKPLIYNGSAIDGIHLTFSEGRVVHASARIGQGTLEQLLRSDEGSTRLGEVALVPDSSPISRMGVTFQSTLYDENASSHLALGQAYRFTLKGSEMTSDEEFAKLGGNSSKVHVDFMVGSNQMEIDGLHADGRAEPIMRQGEWAFEV